MNQETVVSTFTKWIAFHYVVY